MNICLRLVLFYLLPIKDAYLWSLLLVKQFVKDLQCLDPTGKWHNNDLKVHKQVSLEQLYALEVLEDSSIHIVSYCMPTIEDQVNQVVNMLHDTVTPLLVHNQIKIKNKNKNFIVFYTSYDFRPNC